MGVPDVTVQSCGGTSGWSISTRTSTNGSIEVVKTAHAVVVDIAGTSIVEVEVLEVQGDITAYAEAGVSFTAVHAVIAIVSILNESSLAHGNKL